jgi:hypothetical protein
MLLSDAHLWSMKYGVAPLSTSESIVIPLGSSRAVCRHFALGGMPDVVRICSTELEPLCGHGGGVADAAGSWAGSGTGT